MYNICKKCGTENEPEYKFCKNCGENLETEVKNEASQQKTYAGNEPHKNFLIDDYDGVSSEEMVTFIGKKAADFMPKFSKMQLTKSKIAWTWPAAILGYIFGPMGSALWFFYRKMYKPAIILSVIGTVIMVATGLMSQKLDTATIDNAADAFLAGDFEQAMEFFTEINNSISPTQKILNGLSTVINELANICAAVFSGLFGMYIYKNHCIKKIKEYRNFQSDQRFYKLGLAAVGGQSGGMLAVGIVMIVAAENIVTFANLFLTFFK